MLPHTVSGWILLTFRVSVYCRCERPLCFIVRYLVHTRLSLSFGLLTISHHQVKLRLAHTIAYVKVLNGRVLGWVDSPLCTEVDISFRCNYIITLRIPKVNRRNWEIFGIL